MKPVYVAFKVIVIFIVMYLVGTTHALAGLTNENYTEPGSTSGSAAVFIPDWEKRISGQYRLEAFSSSLLGERIDPHTGSITFEHSDISLPGNSGLDVSIRRRLTQGLLNNEYVNVGFADWELSIPKIEATTLSQLSWISGHRCSSSLKDRFKVYQKGTSVYVYPEQYSNGVVLDIPGQNSQQVLNKNSTSTQFPSNASLVTQDGWYLSCISDNYGKTAGFYAHSPNGIKYKLDRLVKIRTKDLAWSDSTTHASIRSSYTRNREMLVASEVTDQNGNWVRYSYSGNNLTSIRANDGRLITIQYSGDLISSITANGRKWSYVYDQTKATYPRWSTDAEALLPFKVLRRVVRPDNLSWDFELDNIKMMPRPAVGCLRSSGFISLTHPNGVTGSFKLAELSHRVSSGITAMLPRRCSDGEPLYMPPGSTPISDIAYLNTIYSLTVISKYLSGPNLEPLRWLYVYENDGGIIDPSQVSETGDGINWTKISLPSGSVETYYHNWEDGDLGGTLVRKSISQGSTVLKDEEYSHVQEAQIGTPLSVLGPNSKTATRPTHITKSILKQNQDTYTTEHSYNTDQSSSLYSFGYPVQTKVWTTIYGSTLPRITTMEYEHNKTKWILGLPKKITVNDRVMTGYTYDPRGQKTAEHRRGYPYATFGYNTDGTTAWAKDAIGRTWRAENWKRGTPQKIIYPDDTFVSQFVDDNGWLTQSIDEKKQVTNYQYDVMGRITQVDPPGSFYLPTNITYNFSGGGAVQTITKGSGQTQITYDAMFRPVLEMTKALDTGWVSYVNTRYDSSGRVTFTSQPSLSAYETAGTEFTYDGLGRILKRRENISPYATTSYSYHHDKRKRVTEPDGKWTDFSSYAYDGPDNEDWRAIYENSNGIYLRKTEINKNIWGELLTVGQWGDLGEVSAALSQYYSYDDRGRICRSYTSEGGATRYEYDDAGQLKAYAKGQHNSGCGPIGSNPARVDLYYDLRGRIKKTDFSDNTPDINRLYDLIGNLTVISRGTGSTEPKWYYAYDELNSLKYEVLYIDGKHFNLSYSYNNTGGMRRMVLPTGRPVDYNPDGLGRARQATGWGYNLATNVNYDIMGGVSSLNYGNGHLFTQQLNPRLLPARTSIKKNGLTAFDRSYGYDALGLITQISDHQDSLYSQSFAYDGLRQLKTATGKWGTATYRIDSLGNIRNKSFSNYPGAGSRGFTMNYDGWYRLSSYTDTDGPNKNLTYDARGNVIGIGDLYMDYDLSDQPVYLGGATSGTYVYDGNLKRVKSIVDGEVIYNIYNRAGQLMHVEDTSKAERSDYVRMGSMMIARFELGKRVQYFHNDHLGSVAASTSSSGTLSGPIEHFTPFGMALNPRATNDNQAAFTGHIRDKATGLTYMQARYYSPEIGRFLSIDPVTFLDTGELGMFNRYAYTLNNPINMIDPDGRQGCGYFCRDLQKYGTPRQVGKNIGNATVNGGKAAAGLAVDFTPVVGDIKAVAEAVANPTISNIAAAAAGLVPGVGDAAGKVIKGATVGRRGQAHNAIGNNKATVIGGREYSGHALDRMQESGMVPSVVEDTIANGTATAGKGDRIGTTKFTTGQAMAVIDDKTGRVITTDPLERKN